MAKQYEQMKLADRPKRWKQKAFEVMNEAVHTRQESLLIQFRLSLFSWHCLILQCFDTVGWASGRASGL